MARMLAQGQLLTDTRRILQIPCHCRIQVRQFQPDTTKEKIRLLLQL